MSECPNLLDYSRFLWNIVEVDEDNLPPFSATGTLEANSNVLTLTAVDEDFTVSLVSGAIITDSAKAVPAWPVTVMQKQLSGWPPPGEVGTYQMSASATVAVTEDAITATNNWVVTTLNVALSIVNRAIACVSSEVYAQAVYNLAADRLINFVPDQPNQTYWQDIRRDMKILSPALGVPTSGSDQGTSGSLLNPDFMRKLTIADLQMLKTPYGRNYIGIAQSFGPELFGLS